MSKEKLYQPSKEFTKKANINLPEYKKMYAESIQSPEKFWGKQAEKLTWFKKWNKVLKNDFTNADVEWFKGGKLNASYNCIDRHLLSANKNKAALIWEGDNPEESRTITYQELYYEVNRFANVLKRMGIKKGDRVLIYLPMIPELAFATLACTRIGAVHSVVFGGFSPESIKSRIEDSKPSIIISADGGYRAGKIIPLKINIDKAIELSTIKVNKVLLVKRTGITEGLNFNPDRDIWYHEELKKPETNLECKPVHVDAEEPMFILYTSGSTGKPKGVLHTTGGYLLGAYLTFYYVFDHKPEDTYFCTADIGWITGHTYLLYGALANGSTSIMFEGVPTYPDAGRLWDIVDKYQVNVLYTAPTAIRSLMKESLDYIKNKSLKSLRLLGSVGEPINPEAWEWYNKYIGKNKCPIVDTWWQTETGCIMLTPLPGAIPTKPGSATVPFFGVQPVIIDDSGKVLTGKGEVSGNLCFAGPWPAMMRSVFGDHKRFKQTYFSQFKGYYFSGDSATRDKDGYYWITGRVDDVIKVSGHRIGSAEVESALLENHAVAEAAVVGSPHDIKGQAIYAYVTLKNTVSPTEELRKDLILTVEKSIGKIARPDVIHWAPGLPKTRSGKIMRRILRKIAANDFETLGDISTLADPSVVQNLIEDKKKHYS